MGNNHSESGTNIEKVIIDAGEDLRRARFMASVVNIDGIGYKAIKPTKMFSMKELSASKPIF
jgi:hypothetical protein